MVGPVFGLVSRESLARIAPYFGALTLVVVLFNGGTQLFAGGFAVLKSRLAAEDSERPQREEPPVGASPAGDAHDADGNRTPS